MPSKAATIDKEVCIRFKMTREHLKLTQYDMADLCETNQALVSMIESGRREVSTTILKILYIKKKISPVYILAGIAPIVLDQDENSILTTMIRDMGAEIQVLKGEVASIKKQLKKATEAI